MLISNGAAKKKLAMLAFLYCVEFVKKNILPLVCYISLYKIFISVLNFKKTDRLSFVYVSVAVVTKKIHYGMSFCVIRNHMQLKVIKILTEKQI